jgi:DnaJ-class molecular chaperone
MSDGYDICPVCNGSGEGLFDNTVCRLCSGSGEIVDEYTEFDMEDEDDD